MTSPVLLALGSNLGPREDHLARARAALAAAGIDTVAASGVHETPALMPDDAPPEWNRPYLNQVLEVRTSRPPHDLLASTQRIEHALGRQAAARWAPRVIDIDLLACGDEVIESPPLVLPHPRLHERRFVLEPLCEIAPRWRHPSFGRTALDLLRTLLTGPRPAVVGILNVTPDSFSGDGQLGRDPLAAAARLIAEGADVLDIGAESTRPQAAPIDPADEWRRLQPVLAALARTPRPRGLRLGIDTRHAATAERALDLGVDLVNDVSALADPAMGPLVARRGADLVVMHATAIPADVTQLIPADADPVAVVLQWKADVTARATAAGIAPAQLVFDPGLGFGKHAPQSLALVLRARELVCSGGRWLFGPSRKGFLKLLTAAPAAGRDDVTLALSAVLAEAGVPMVRVHDVARHVALFDAIRPIGPFAGPLPSDSARAPAAGRRADSG